MQQILDWEVPCIDHAMEEKIQKNWDQIAKPLDSMGVFEPMWNRIGAILHRENFDIQKRALIIMMGDNGIVEEGISQSGQEVTAAVAVGMGKDETSVGKICELTRTTTIPIDIGINGDASFAGVRNCKVRKGTRNFSKEPAMTREEALQAIAVGMEVVKECKEAGYQILGTGEMGIGNTTTSSACTAALLQVEAERVTGKGAGLSTEGLSHKIEVIQQAIAKYHLYEADALTILETVGGLDIAGLVGIFLGGARYEIPIVADGLISLTAALLAERIKPGAKEYVIASHGSREPATALLVEALGVRPVIDASMALGEGAGAAMLYALMDCAQVVYMQNRTFSDIAIADYQRFEGEK